MTVPAFVPRIPLLPDPPSLNPRPTPRRSRHHRFHLATHPRATLTDSAAREVEVTMLETRLRALDAPEAADLAYVSFTTHTPPPPWPTWQPLLDTLSAHAITGRTLSRIASRLGIHALLTLPPSAVPPVLHHLSATLSLTTAQRNRVITHRPDILRTPLPALSASTDALLAFLDPRDLKHIALRWPGVLLLPHSSITRVTTFLSTRPALLSPQNIRCLLRRAPWVLVYDIDRDMAPTVHWLRDELLPFAPAPLATYLLASPQLLGTTRTRLHAVMAFLRDDIGMDTASRVAVVRQFPPLLTCSADAVLRPAAVFLSHDVGLEDWQLSKVVRAFPTVLTLDVETDMRGVVDYFRNRGISNVARLVTRLPPMLGYNLDTDIIPKVEFVENVLGLSVYDIMKFPAYFSYDLRKRIEPRTRFLQFAGVSNAEMGLNVALPLTDDAFCNRIGASVEAYYEFRKACYQRRAGIESGDGGGSVRGEARVEGQGVDLEVNNTGKASLSGGESDEPYAWNERKVDTSKRRKKRFRATLTRMPWTQVGENS